MDILNTFLFAGLPYLALVIFFVGTIYRYKYTGFQVSSLSSQFLETKSLFWGSVPFHFGILFVLFLHLSCWLIPSGILLWNSNPVRLIALEITGFAFGLSAFVGLAILFYRRLTNVRVKMVSNSMDYFIELLLLAQIGLGLWIAYAERWGSSWFAADLSPYVWSILTFQPEIGAVSAMPVVIQAHIIGALTIIAVFPFTRLVHLLVAPLHYLFRPYQQVIWNWDRRAVRDPETAWSDARPRNN